MATHNKRKKKAFFSAIILPLHVSTSYLQVEEEPAELLHTIVKVPT